MKSFELVEPTTVQEAVAQTRMAVGTCVVGSKNAAFYLVEGNVSAADLQADHVVFGHAVFFGGVNPVGIAHGLNRVDDGIGDHFAIVHAVA